MRDMTRVYRRHDSCILALKILTTQLDSHLSQFEERGKLNFENLYMFEKLIRRLLSRI